MPPRFQKVLAVVLAAVVVGTVLRFSTDVPRKVLAVGPSAANVPINWTRVDNTDPSVTKSGGVASTTNANYYGGSIYFSNTPGEYVQYTFTGDSVRWIGSQNTGHGMAGVYIDSVYQTTIDTYNFINQDQQVLYELTGLNSGQHTLKVVILNQKNSASSNYYVDWDAFDYGASQVSWTKLDNTDSSVTTSANVYSASGASYYGGSTYYSNVAGAFVQFAFNGDSVRWIGAQNTDHGEAAVYIDGLYQMTVDTYRASFQPQRVLYEADLLAVGQHTLKVVVLNQKNSASSNYFIDWDAFQYGISQFPWTMIDNTDANVTISGSVASTNNSRYYGGSIYFSNLSGDYVQFLFSGDRVRWIGTRNSDHGIAEVYIDGTDFGPVDSYNPTEQDQQVLYEKTGLSSGQHTLKVVVLNQKNAASSNYYVDWDAFADHPQNLALGAQTWTSSNVSPPANNPTGLSYTGAQAVDGDYGTYWASNGQVFPSWLEVDLGAPFPLQTISNTFVNNDGQTDYYRFEGSLDNSTWTTLADRTGTGVQGQTVTETVRGTYRYVRMTVTNMTNGAWASSKEFQVSKDLTARTTSRTSYVSSTAGSDTYDGLAATWNGTDGPWRTLGKASQMDYIPGDQILLKAGDTFTDGLVVNGSGTPSNPILISSFGSGPLPVINRGDKTQGSGLRALVLNTAGGQKVTNLELTTAFHGIRAITAQYNMDYLWLENLLVHHISEGRATNVAGDADGYGTELLSFLPKSPNAILSDVTVKSTTYIDNHNGFHDSMGHFDVVSYSYSVSGGQYEGSRNVTVQDSLFQNTDLWALVLESYTGNVIHNNFVHNNTQYCFAGAVAGAIVVAENVTWQYNEFSENVRAGTSPDGEHLDFEAFNHNDTVMFNSFHDSDGPAILISNETYSAGNPLNFNFHDNVFYNNAQNTNTSVGDQPANFWWFYPGTQPTGQITSNAYYNLTGVINYPSNTTGVTISGNHDLSVTTETKGTNYALTATATASSNNASAGNVNDGNLATTWSSATGSNEWLELDWTSSVTLNELEVDQAGSSSINNYAVQYWDASASLWRTVFTSLRSMGTTKYMPTYPFTTTKVRLLINTTASGVATIAEFKAYNVAR